jgi:hypothetical protein
MVARATQTEEMPPDVEIPDELWMIWCTHCKAWLGPTDETDGDSGPGLVFDSRHRAEAAAQGFDHKHVAVRVR